MKVFNEEVTNGRPGSIILLEDKFEGRELLSALAFFKEQNPRRKKAIKLINQLEERLGCY